MTNALRRPDLTLLLVLYGRCLETQHRRGRVEKRSCHTVLGNRNRHLLACENYLEHCRPYQSSVAFLNPLLTRDVNNQLGHSMSLNFEKCVVNALNMKTKIDPDVSGQLWLH